MPGRAALLVVAGEGSGDSLAAEVVRALGARAAGLGGAALRDAGAELAVDLDGSTAMGVGGVLARAPAIARVAAKLEGTIRRERPRAALLAGYSEFNGWLGRRLRRRGVRVLWYGAPQIWAWRPRRGRALRRSCDRMAVVLPFEEKLWRGLGVDAHYVGHPAVGARGSRLPVPAERHTTHERIALLPGSRPHEVRRHLGPMLEAARTLASRRVVESRVLLAPSLDERTRRWATDAAGRSRIAVGRGNGAGGLPGFDAAIACSGTVTLECAASGVPPVIAYRTDRLTAEVGKRLVRVDSIGLPNIVLGERVFPELLQGEVTGGRLADECEALLDGAAAYRARCAEVRQRLAAPPPDTASPAQRVARFIEPWLD